MIPQSELVRLARTYAAETFLNFGAEEFIFTVEGLTAFASSLKEYSSGEGYTESNTGPCAEGDGDS